MPLLKEHLINETYNIFESSLDLKEKINAMIDKLVQINIDNLKPTLDTPRRNARTGCQLNGLVNIKNYMSPNKVDITNSKAKTQSERRNSLLFGEIEEKLNEDLKFEIVKLVCEVMKILLTKEDIRFCYRYGKKKPGYDRLVLVRFQSRYIYSLVWKDRKMLINNGYTLIVHMPMNVRMLARNAEEAFGRNNCLIFGGRITVITPDGIAHSVDSVSQLDKLREIWFGKK